MKNSFSAVGRIVSDPERKSPDLVTARFVVDAVRNSESDMYFSVKFWDKLSLTAEKYLTKGRNIFVTGELTLREANDKQYYDIRVYNFDLSVGNKSRDTEAKSEVSEPKVKKEKKEKIEADGSDIPF